MAEASTGAVVDERYQLRQKIGSGGMADVWLAEDTELDRNVAIKILHDRFAQDKEFVERFQREAKAAAGLQHPNVVGVFDRGSFRDTYFIAMEYVDGPSLKDLINMTEGGARQYFMDMAGYVLLGRNSTVATMPIRVLAGSGGVLEQLRRSGYTIESPH